MRNESAATQGLRTAYDWDFFLAHAGADLEIARSLKGNLEPPAKVFLDDDNLLPGDDFDVVLNTAQQSSLISVVLVSLNTETAYYQREEIAAAVQMAREDRHTHRVVPVYLNVKQTPPGVPYGLRLKHSLYVSSTDDLARAGQRLLRTLQMMQRYEEKKEEVVAAQRTALTQLTAGNNKTEVLAGFNEVTKFVRPLLKMLLIIFALMLALLAASLLLPYFAEVRALLAAVFGSLCALLLASILWLSARSLNYAQQIAQGQLNGG